MLGYLIMHFPLLVSGGVVCVVGGGGGGGGNVSESLFSGRPGHGCIVQTRA